MIKFKLDRKRKITIIAIVFIIISLIFFIIYWQTNRAPSRGPITTDTGKIVNNDAVKSQRDELYKKNPLLADVPYYNSHFRVEIDHISQQNIVVYKITLETMLNRPTQLETYKKEYAQYKTEATKWISEKGADYKKLKIIWAPKDPAYYQSNPYYNPKDQD